MTQPSQWELALGLFVGNIGNEAIPQITGAKDYVSFELPECHLCCYVETSCLRMKSRISRTRRLWETLREDMRESEHEAEREKLNPDDITWA